MITTGFTTGAANKNATPTESGNPFWYRRRVTGTTPHSHTGKANPNNAPTNGQRGSVLIDPNNIEAVTANTYTDGSDFTLIANDKITVENNITISPNGSPPRRAFSPDFRVDP